MKHPPAILIAACLLATLAACGGEPPPPANDREITPFSIFEDAAREGAKIMDEMGNEREPIEEVRMEGELAVAEAVRTYGELMAAYQELDATHPDPWEKKRARDDATKAKMAFESRWRGSLDERYREGLASDSWSVVKQTTNAAVADKNHIAQKLDAARQRLAALEAGPPVE